MLAMSDGVVTNGAAKRGRLAQRRKAVGLTQEQLAEQLGVERTTVIRWERSQTTPLPYMRPRLARALRVSADRLDELLGDVAPAETTPGADAGMANHAAPWVPRQLPAAAANFTGRTAELEALAWMLDDAVGCAPGMAAITVIGGTAGVGKTALAVQWAHLVSGRFPDGQLYVDLRGYDPDQPMRATDAVAGFLRALGVRGQDLPPEQDERAARYRSLVAGKQVLVILDNAGLVEQVRPLLPGSASCAVLVTSRDSLAGLVARDGARRLELELLKSADAISLLRTLVGNRIDDEPGAAETLAAQCCGLPLALRIAAELAAARPSAPLAELTIELADRQRRLELLQAGGDPRTAVRAVFSWSYRHLDAHTSRAFRLVGLHPGRDFDQYAAAALIGTDLEKARRELDVLGRAHLIQPAGPGRYDLHDLLRAYARELAGRDGQEEHNQALTRLFDHYLHGAAVAMDSLYPADRDRRPRIPAPAAPAPPVIDPAAARAWLGAELATLVTVTAHAAQHGWPSHAIRLARTMWLYLDNGGHYPEAVTVHSHARAAAREAGDCRAEGMALRHLAGAHFRQNRYQQAAGYLNDALELFQQIGDCTGQARVLHNLGLICHGQGRYADAIALHRQALDLYRETGDLAGEAHALGYLGISEERQGRYDEAARHHRQALTIAAKTGARDIECIALVNLGTVALRQGRYDEATGHLERALALCRDLGYREAEAESLTRIGDICLRQGQTDEAARHLREALALYREMDNRSGEADALNSLGEVLLAADRPDDAIAQHYPALRLADQIGDKYQQIRAHHGIGQAAQADQVRAQAATAPPYRRG